MAKHETYMGTYGTFGGYDKDMNGMMGISDVCGS
jgi:hypothetical protein